MRRRNLIAAGVVATATTALSPPAWARQSERLRRVGVLLGYPEDDPTTQASVTAFAHALARLGWVEGENIWIDYRFAPPVSTNLKTYAAELVALSSDVILAGPTPAVVAVRQHTLTIPIVFVRVADPVGQGLAESLARPGGNVTGFFLRCTTDGKMAAITEGGGARCHPGCRHL
jgi:putative ABC transport system substrate-binding protein